MASGAADRSALGDLRFLIAVSQLLFFRFIFFLYILMTSDTTFVERIFVIQHGCRFIGIVTLLFWGRIDLVMAVGGGAG